MKTNGLLRLFKCDSLVEKMLWEKLVGGVKTTLFLCHSNNISTCSLDSCSSMFYTFPVLLYFIFGDMMLGALRFSN